ncbi:MAG: hypothetical protein K5771_06900 [Oscillospiraceae bacterium]|nr:hypothetical protein [Oscillospiraceae bacterium]
MEEKKKKDIKKTAVAITTAAALMTSGLFKDPAEIVKDEEVYAPPPPIVETIDRAPVEDEPDDMTVEDEEKKTPKDKLRDLLLRMPRAVRIILLLPLWCIGTALMTVLTPLFSAVLPPLLNIMIRWVLIAAVLVALAAAACKLIFPDIPLKKVFSKKNMLSAVIYGAFVGMSGWVLEELYPESRFLVPGVYAGAAALFIGGCMITAAFRKEKREAAKA